MVWVVFLDRFGMADIELAADPRRSRGDLRDVQGFPAFAQPIQACHNRRS
jgi:hypothetical protein